MESIYKLQQRAETLRRKTQVDSISQRKLAAFMPILWHTLPIWSRMLMALAFIRCTRAMQQ